MSEKLLQAAIKLREAQRDYLSDLPGQQSELKGARVGIAAAQLDLVIAEIQLRQKANKFYEEVMEATELLMKVDYHAISPQAISKADEILRRATSEFERSFPNE